MTRSQLHREIAVTSPLGDDALFLHSMNAVEHLSRPFRTTLTLTSEDQAIPFDQLIGQPMAVRLDLPAGGFRAFHGIVSRFALTGVERGISRYEATLVPWLWLLTRSANCRIFQGLTVPEIIAEVFRTHGFADFDEALTATYPARDYCVQYRETDFNFVSRIMEQEGISYFFEHEEDRHRLVLADAPTSFLPRPGYERISYSSSPHEAAVDDEIISRWTVAHNLQPCRYALNDFDFTHPRKNLHVRSQTVQAHDHANSEVFDYPGEYSEFADGERLARIRLEELQARHESISGTTNARGVAVGSTFELVDHPHEDQAREYLITSARYLLKGDDPDSSDGAGAVFGCSFDATDARTIWRPPRETPRPIIQGPQTAIVTGKAGEDYWTDAHGRIKVQFPWDRQGQADETSSCWIRVAQPSAGKGWGAISVPRIGHEVIVEFLEGDPDRPIVVGRVYNGESKPPYALPEHASISTIKTNSTRDACGFNELRFQDKAGEEELFLHAARDLEIRAQHNRHESIACSRHLTVGGDQVERVHGDKHQTIETDVVRQIKGDFNDTVLGEENHATTKDHYQYVGQNSYETVRGDSRVSVVGKRTMSVDGNLTIDVDNIAKIRSRQARCQTETLFVSGKKLLLYAAEEITISVGGVGIEITPGGIKLSGPVVDMNKGMISSGKLLSKPIETNLGMATDEPKLPRAAAKAVPGERCEPDDPGTPEQPTELSPAALVLRQAAQDGTPFVEQCPLEAAEPAEPPIDEPIEDPADGAVLVDDSMFDDDGTFSQEAVDHLLRVMALEDSPLSGTAPSRSNSSPDTSMFDDDGTFSQAAVDDAIAGMPPPNGTALPNTPAAPDTSLFDDDGTFSQAAVDDAIAGMPPPNGTSLPNTPTAPDTSMFDDDGTFSQAAVDDAIAGMPPPNGTALPNTPTAPDTSMFDDDGTFSQAAVDDAIAGMPPPNGTALPNTPSAPHTSMFDDDGTFSQEAVDHLINTMQLEDSNSPSASGASAEAAPDESLFDDDGTFSQAAVDHLVDWMQLE